MEPPPRLVALTGGPCSGKTTLLRALARRGWPTVREAATDVLRAGGLDPRRAPLEFQREVFRRQLRREREALRRREGPVVCDRGLGDHFGYLAFHGVAPFPALARAWSAARGRYAAAILCEPAPEFRTDGVRYESPGEAARLHGLLRDAWASGGLVPVPLPWVPVEERAEAVERILRRL